MANCRKQTEKPDKAGRIPMPGFGGFVLLSLANGSRRFPRFLTPDS
jgi:hypothetical protein